MDKALAVLRGEGLVKTVTGRGIYVTAPKERLPSAGDIGGAAAYCLRFFAPTGVSGRIPNPN